MPGTEGQVAEAQAHTKDKGDGHVLYVTNQNSKATADRLRATVS